MPNTRPRKAGRPPRIPASTIDHVRRLALYGLTYAQIARALNITPQYAGQLVAGKYRAPKVGRPPRITKENILAARTDLANGVAQAIVAKRYALHTSYVSQLRSNLNRRRDALPASSARHGA